MYVNKCKKCHLTWSSQEPKDTCIECGATGSQFIGSALVEKEEVPAEGTKELRVESKLNLKPSAALPDFKKS